MYLKLNSEIILITCIVLTFVTEKFSLVFISLAHIFEAHKQCKQGNKQFYYLFFYSIHFIFTLNNLKIRIFFLT